MDNQHRMIKGYKELDEHQITLMNQIKEMGAEVGKLAEDLKKRGEQGNANVDQRWIAEGVTHLQTGFMCLTRAIARPDFF